MTEIIDPQPESTRSKTVRGSLYDLTRTILLAGIGAISLAPGGIKYLLRSPGQRGEMAEADARKLVREVMERREKLEKEHRQQVAEAKQQAAKPAEATRADIDALNARISELSVQIEELRARKAAGTAK